MRFPVVLFDLDGTLIDSGSIILASFRHATRSVLGREFPDRELVASAPGSTLEVQMSAFDPDRVDELVAAYRAHNTPLHDELECCLGMFCRGSVPILDSPVEGESVYNEIQELLDQPQSADLPRIERTLTDGYARALSLEAERLRVERQIAEIATALARGDEAQTRELSVLGRRLKDSDDALTKLRTLLAALRERADEARDVA